MYNEKAIELVMKISAAFHDKVYAEIDKIEMSDTPRTVEEKVKMETYYKALQMFRDSALEEVK